MVENERHGDSISRRTVLKHSAAAASVSPLALGGNAVAQRESEGEVRLIEAAIVYDVASELPENTELEGQNICPDGMYSVEGGTVTVPPSPAQERILGALQTNDIAVNFGGLSGITDGQFGGVPTRSLVSVTTRDTVAHKAWLVASDSTHRMPSFVITPDGSGTSVVTDGQQSTVDIGETLRQDLGSESVALSAIEFSEGTFSNPNLPERMLAQKHEITARTVTVEPQLRVKDLGVLDIEAVR